MKNRDLRFVWSLFLGTRLEFYYDDIITMMSLTFWAYPLMQYFTDQYSFQLDEC